ncbi:MAG: NAD(P)-dependent oxidoreductase [Chloroflexota bacterium]
MTKRILVTGGSGKAGRAVMRDLIDHGYDALNVDIVPPAEPAGEFIRADLTNMGETTELMFGVDAVVHLAAIPAPGRATEEVTFRTNITSTFNVFEAAARVGIKRMVWASSETTLGLPFDDEQPAYAPIDEDHPLYPESSYALSKVLMEEMGRQYYRRFGMTVIGLRFSNVMEPHDYARFPAFSDDPMLRKWNLWGYVDARDTAQSCRLGLETDFEGADHFIIAAADTCMTQTNADLMQAVFPDVELRDIGEHKTLLSIDRAHEVLGYDPQYSWRDMV